MSDRPADLEALLAARMPALTKAAESGSVDAYAVESFLLNLEIAQIGANKLLGDLLRSISLRTLRYVRMGHAARPQDLPDWAQSWHALYRSVARRELEKVLDLVAKRIDDTRDTAIAALGSESGAAAPAARYARTTGQGSPRAPKVRTAVRTPHAVPMRVASRA
jgi:DNA-binding GntR family transcriptional regulator